MAWVFLKNRFGADFQHGADNGVSGTSGCRRLYKREATAATAARLISADTEVYLYGEFLC